MQWSLDALPWWCLPAAGWYGLISLASLVTYARDKSAARRGRRRVRERTLHLIDLAGGWPGALLAQHLFRHKRQKFSFYAVTWLIAAGHVGVWVLVWRAMLSWA